MRVLAVFVCGVVGCAFGGLAAVAQTAEYRLPQLSSSDGMYMAQPPASMPSIKRSIYAPTPAPGALEPTVSVSIQARQTTVPVVAPAFDSPAKSRILRSPKAETALPSDPNPIYQPGTLAATLKAADRYTDIVKTGGWPTDIAELNSRTVGPEVAKLRKRLAIEGDQSTDEPVEGPAAQIWDEGLTESVKRFQERMGLRATGVVAGETLKEINVAAEVRAAALAASAERASAFNFLFGDRYVVVNLPSTEVEAVENGQVVHRYVAIVGDTEHPSPQIAAHVSHVTLNPTWTLPISIIKKEIIPRMQRDPGYLARQKIRILDASNVEVDPKSIDWTTNRAANYTLRQDSGSGNSLGVIRISMPNKLAVYMHDTPGKRLFGADYRFLSHGCVRVQDVFDYAEWLLEGAHTADGGDWDKTAMLAKVKEGTRFDIKVERPTPVIWVYLTGWANADGVAHFRNDVYGLDNPAVAHGGKAVSVDLTAATEAR
jgi:L,D-transpeptidase YcbB